MQHLDHDMDELFQKAAEDYPLKIGDSDWGKIAMKITSSSSSLPIKSKSSSNRKKYFITALLLLFTLLISDIVVRMRSNMKLDDINAISKENLSVEKEKVTGDRVSNSDLKVAHEIISGSKDLLPNTILSFESKSHQDLLTKYSAPEISFYPDDINVFNRTIQPVDQIQRETAMLPLLNSFSIKEKNSPSVSLFNNNKDVNKKEPHGFYWGLLAGPQLNQVKSQGLTKTGFTIGIPVGFRLNKNISIESGLFHSTKYYFSTGKHFKMTKPDPTMPSNTTIMDVSGKGNVFEIPLKFKFDIISAAKNKFFISTGITSYILTKENNNYYAMVNGSPEYMNRSYKKNSTYAASGFQLSAGFERTILQQTTIRIEPYLVLPLKGVGMGEMPLTTNGLHLGFIMGKRRP